MDAFEFYEEQTAGLGVEFLEVMFSELERLDTTAGIHPIRFGHYHLCVTRRFPFGIFYRIDGKVVSVEAILDCRRDPDSIRSRLN